MQSYWTRLLGERLTRRRVLAASGGGAMTAALLAACGGSESGGEQQKASGMVVKPVDTTKQGKAGGTFKGMVASDVQTLEPSFRSQPTGPFNQRAYQSFLVQKPGYFEPAKDEYEGDAVESWEFSPDRLTLTMKLRTQGKFDQRAPTNGRNLEASDVIYSWERYARIGALRADYANAVNPSAPIISMTAPDSKTIVAKLSEPQAGIIALLAARTASSLWVLPKESDGGFDLRKEQRGSGAYVLVEHVPSSRFAFEKSQNYWNKDKPLVQRIEYPLLSEYAQALAQFKTGSVYTFVLRSEDIIRTKKETPEVNLYQGDVVSSSGGARWFFGWEDSAKAPFKDVRLREAFSLAVDRDLFLETFNNVSGFESEGISMDRRWNTALNCSAEGWWLDPEGKDFGPNAKFFKHDIAEAKKLVAAAGFPNGLDAEAHHIITNDYGAEFPKWVEVLLGMVRDSGIRFRSVPANFATDWQQKYRDVKGNFDGIAFSTNPPSGDNGDTAFAHYNSNGSQFQGWEAEGKSTFKGDPMMDDLTNKIRREFDVKKRYALAHELQRHEAKMQYHPLFPGGVSGLNLVWPAVENYGVYTGGYFLEYYLWVNDTKAPARRA